MPIFVTANIYSGIPNPVWRLTSAQEKEFTSFFSKTKKAIKAPVLPTWRLGYVGFYVQLVNVEKQGYESLHVFYSFVIDSKGTGFKDSNLRMEKYLLKSGLNSLTADQYHQIQTAILGNEGAVISYQKKLSA